LEAGLKPIVFSPAVLGIHQFKTSIHVSSGCHSCREAISRLMRRYTFQNLCKETKPPNPSLESRANGEAMLVSQYQSIRTLKGQINDLFLKLETLSPPLPPPTIPVGDSLSPKNSQVQQQTVVAPEKRHVIEELIDNIKKLIRQYDDISSNFGNSVQEPTPGNSRLIQLVKLSVKHDVAAFSSKMTQVPKY